ncbi:MAG: ROK family protein [Candidatus Borkfalkia sp.]
MDGRTAFRRESGRSRRRESRQKLYFLSGRGIANLVNLLRPQAVIIGGGICNEGEYLLQPLRRWVGERIYVDGETIPLVIARAKLGNDAGIYGAAALAMGR